MRWLAFKYFRIHCRPMQAPTPFVSFAGAYGDGPNLASPTALKAPPLDDLDEIEDRLPRPGQFSSSIAAKAT
jgi:hypothetical protein